MSFYSAVLEHHKERVRELQENGIIVHTDFPGTDQKTIDYLALFVLLESSYRVEQTTVLPSLAELEKRYFGIEVGNLRRYFNRLFESELDYSRPLLDFGCGGPWWKDSYWRKSKEVYGIEINPSVLMQLRKQFKDAGKYHLVFTVTGLTSFPCESFEQVLSSSVIGYLLPRQAECHLAECWRLVAPGGKLILTRVNAYRHTHLFAGPMSEAAPGSFAYAYTKKDLFRLISQTCPNHRVEKYRKIGFLLPYVSFTNRYTNGVIQRLLGRQLSAPVDTNRLVQGLFGYRFGGFVDRAVNLVLPLLGIHHFVVLRKP